MPVVTLPPGTDLPRSIELTYRTLRLGLGVVAFALPLVLALIGFARGISLQGSISAYYHTSMRDVFVGVLFAAGATLFLYKGFSPKEDWALNLAGTFAVLAALVPTPTDGRFSLHGTFAVLFFVCLAYVAIFRSRDTLVLIENPERLKHYRSLYFLLGAAMVALPLGAFVLVSLLEFDRDPDKRRAVYFVELFATWAFGFFWLAKSREIRRTQQEQESKPHGTAVRLA
jgi:hypothetical protein